MGQLLIAADLQEDKLLGKKVRHSLSNLTGMAISKVEYLSGCSQYKIIEQDLDKAGKEKHHYVDACYLSLCSADDSKPIKILVDSFMIPLGRKVCDKVTDRNGVIFAREMFTDYSVCYGVRFPKESDDIPDAAVWRQNDLLDQLDCQDAGAIVNPSPEAPGGPQSHYPDSK